MILLHFMGYQKRALNPWQPNRWKVNKSTVFFVYFKDLFIHLFLERGRQGEREGEKHQYVVASCVPPTGTWLATQACALTGNWTSNPLVHRPALNPLSHTSQGCFHIYKQAKTHLRVTFPCVFSTSYHARGNLLDRGEGQEWLFVYE